jgi:hypothetical protein
MFMTMSAQITDLHENKAFHHESLN